jgi:hypothetical protein
MTHNSNIRKNKMITVKINKTNVLNVKVADVKSQVLALGEMSFINYRDLHFTTLEHAKNNTLTEDDFVNAVSIYLSINNIDPSNIKWFRLDHSDSGIVSCHGSQDDELNIYRNIINQLSSK